ncbi:hypothetical protein FD723_18530 [Nostoc sp. C052]|uniref:hypothetical protein n=1 Tax=Nostoc sp. C052 TaxID=2576902 RepID=UPI0015C2C311|nr:hypothetical protein [Nostoc sp. C052]QLE42217.1 hypothetical protein FD723_18530 [Nostoc sp. C052]
MINLQGDSEFHEGWLHGVFKLPCIPEIPNNLANESWRLGYQTAIETGDNAILAIPPMIKNGQIIVTNKTNNQ